MSIVQNLIVFLCRGRERESLKSSFSETLINCCEVINLRFLRGDKLSSASSIGRDNFLFEIQKLKIFEKSSRFFSSFIAFITLFQLSRILFFLQMEIQVEVSLLMHLECSSLLPTRPRGNAIVSAP